MLESESAAAGINVHVPSNDTSSRYSNCGIGVTTEGTKILIDEESDRTVGAHLVGPGYGELISVVVLEMKTWQNTPAASFDPWLRATPHRIRPRIDALTYAPGQLDGDARPPAVDRNPRSGAAVLDRGP